MYTVIEKSITNFFYWDSLLSVTELLKKPVIIKVNGP